MIYYLVFIGHSVLLLVHDLHALYMLMGVSYKQLVLGQVMVKAILGF